MTQPVPKSAEVVEEGYLAAGYVNRMRIYCREMYPLASRLTAAALLYISFTICLAVIQEVPARIDFRWATIGVAGGFLLPLLLRLMDELKDRAIDQRLFPERPLPSGRVHLNDIKVTLVAVAGLFLIIHLAAGPALLSAAFLLGYSVLMYRYFFLPPSLKSKLLVNLGTHNPVVLLLLLHYVYLFSLQNSLPVESMPAETFALVGMYWALFLAWEVGRKVCYPDEETEYQTYSGVLGYVGAALLAGFIQTLAVVAVIIMVHGGNLSPVYLVVVLVAYVLLLRDYLRFLTRRLDSGRALRGSAERFATLMMSAGLVELISVTVKRHVM